MTHDEAIAFLHSRLNYESRGMPDQAELRVDRTAMLLDRLGRPQDRYPIIHVAGTKGKGSTATMIAALIADAGFKVGLHTSPHLASVEERFRVNGQAVAPKRFAELVEQVRPAVQAVDKRLGASQPPLTFFEITTALALLHFHRVEVQAAVVEVGMGGRLDSTNVVDPAVCVLTNISLDHTKQLGSTIAEIAGEKAGIIKPGKPVVSSAAAEDARVVIRERALRVGARLREWNVDFDVICEPRGLEGSDVEVATWRRRWPKLRIAPVGAHQCANAATAMAAIDALIESGLPLREEAIGPGLSRLAIPGRFEVLSSDPRVILDVAHNPASFEALAATLDAVLPPSGRGRRILVFAVSRDKDWRGMWQAIRGRFDTVVVTQYTSHQRALPASVLAAHVGKSGARVITTGSVEEAWLAVLKELESKGLRRTSSAASLSPDEDVIVATGSFYLVAELRDLPIPRH